MEIKREDIIIEGDTALWKINAEGNNSGTYIGLFKFRCTLTPTQKIAASREYTQLLGGYPSQVPEHESFLAYALTQLKHRVVEAPPFWKTGKDTGYDGDLVDVNILEVVLNAAVEAELKYKESLKERKENALARAIKAANSQLQQRDSEDTDEDDQEE